MLKLEFISNTIVILNLSTFYRTPSLYSILVQKHASRAYCHAGQVLTISQTGLFGIVLWISASMLEFMNLSASESYCEFQLKRLHFTRNCRQEAQSLPYQPLTTSSPPLPLSTPSPGIELSEERVHIRRITHVHSIRNMYLAMKKVLPSLFSLHSHIVLHGIFLQRRL